MSQIFISLVPLMALALILIAGLVLLLRGWRGDPELAFPTCAGCGYDLRGTNLAAAPECPECGKSLAAPRAVNFGRYRRKPRLMIVGATLILAPVLFVFITAQRIHRSSPAAVASQSTASLIQNLSQTADTPWPWNELSRRHSAGALSNEEIGAAIDQLIAHLNAQPPGSKGPLHWSGAFVDAALAGGHLSQEQRARLYDAYYKGPPDVTMRTRVRSGQTVQFMLNSGTHWNLPGVQTVSCLKAIRIGDREVKAREFAGKETLLSSGGAFGLDGSLVIDADPGQHMVTFDVEIGLIDEREGDFGPGLPERWPPTLRRWSHSIQVPMQVIPRDQSPIELVRDPALEPQVRQAVRIRQVWVSGPPGGETAKVDLWFDKKPPVPLSFDVIIQFADTEINVGSFSASGSGGYGTSGFQRRINALPESIEHVNVLLRPNPGQVESSFGVDRLWAGELLYEQVPIVRDDEDVDGAQPD